MSKKTVTVHIVDYSSDYSFSDILMDEKFHGPFLINDIKTCELKFVERKNDIITGIFVTTQKKGIPPTHTPGDDNDYSAILLNEGQGLAYPNAILYNISTNSLYIESNRLGLNEKRICEYFMGIASKNNIPMSAMTLAPILKSEAYERVSNMLYIDSIECRIANPLNLIREEMNETALGSLRGLASNLNATKDISVILKSEEEEGGIAKKKVLEIIDFFSKCVTGTSFSRKNKLKVKGRKTNIEGQDTDGLIEENVDFFLDKIRDTFEIEEPNIASHLQVFERIEGIKSVFNKCNSEVSRIAQSIYRSK